MIDTDDRLDRLVQGVQELNVNLERLRIGIETLVRTTDDHETRLRSVERWKQHLTPVLAAATFVLGAVATEMLKRLV